ncbi:MAG TPA: 16S rRNA processing protein RimM [Eggerthellaceae bacterium]|nr:16S rRNA processing protein RimM [Eggerthellaceae bacterium]
MREWIDVATLAKPKNLDGRLVVRSTAGLPFLLCEGDEVAFVPPRTDLPRRAVVESVRETGDRTAEVLFRGVGGPEAHGLAGCHCLIRRSLLDEQLFETEPALWDGWAVRDERAGEIGTVSGLVDNGAQALLEVARPDGSTLLVPVVDEIVSTADPEARIVLVSLPNGLLDL